MKVEKNNPSFGRLVRNPKTISPELYKAIVNTPAVKKFARRYDALVSVEPFYSSKQHNKIQMGLRFENITPSHIFSRIKKLITKSESYKTLQFNTHAVDEAGLVESLQKKHPSAITKLYKNMY